MKHPELPDGQLIEVDDASVPHLRASGWAVTDAPPPPRPDVDGAPTPAGDPQADPESEPEPQAPNTGRRAAVSKEAKK